MKHHRREDRYGILVGLAIVVVVLAWIVSLVRYLWSAIAG